MRGISLLAVGLLALTASAALAQQTRSTGIKLVGDAPIQIESDKLEVREADSMATFSGNVTVVQGDTTMKAGVMKVFYVRGGEGSAATGTSDIDRLEVSNKVYLKSKTQVATGEQGTFDAKKEILTLTGDVVLTEGGNVATGCKLTVHTQTGEAQLDSCGGRVTVTIQKGAQGN